MKGKILSIALALCMVAVVFTAFPAKAAVYYTGSVQTTDDAGESKNVFFRGDRVYMDVELFYEGVPSESYIRVDLVDRNDVTRNTIYAWTNVPEAGVYESWNATPAGWLNTNSVPMPSGANMVECSVVVSVQDFWWMEVTRTQIVIRDDGVTLDPPPSWYYYPGQEITITVTTGHTDAFYVKVLNETSHVSGEDWTYQTTDASGVWSEVWTVPADAKDGDYRVLVGPEPTDDVWYEEWFYVAKYALIVDSDRYNVLPGETVTIDYMVLDMSTLALYYDVTVEWTALWYDLDGEEQMGSGTLVPGYKGSAEFLIPADINLTSDYWLYFWANDTQGRSMDASGSLSIGQLSAEVSTSGYRFVAGEIVTVTVSASVGWDSLPDADVDISVEKDGAVIDEYGAAGLTTGRSGTVQHEFALGADVKQGTYLVRAEVSKVGYSVERMATFVVEVSYDFTVSLDKDQYYAGETAVIEFVTFWGADQVVNNTVLYLVYYDYGVLDANNTNTGVASVTLPMDYIGYISVEAVTIVNGYPLSDWDEAWVQKAYIALAPVADVYNAGETVQWNYQLMTAMTDGMLSYVVKDGLGTTVASASLTFSTAGTISFTVPASPSPQYTATLTLKDGQGNAVSESSSAWLRAEYTVSVWVSGSSGYMSRAFEPGNTVELEYVISTNGVHKPLYKIRFYSTTDSAVDFYVLTPATSGKLTVEIPEVCADGNYAVYVSVYDGMTNGYLTGSSAQFGVLDGQSVWERNVLGMSLIDFVILVLIVLMIVLLIVVPYMKGRAAAKPKETYSAPPEQPPEPPPEQ